LIHDDHIEHEDIAEVGFKDDTGTALDIPTELEQDIAEVTGQV